MLILLFIIAILPTLLVVKKITKRENITFLDITIVGTTAYFILIPYKAYYIDDIENFNLYKYIATLCETVVYIYVLYIFNMTFKGMKILNMTKIIKDIDENVYVSYRVTYLCLITGVMMLYRVANYSSLDADNLEGNNELYFGSDMPIYLRMIWLFVSQTLPILFIYALKNFKTGGDRKKNIISLVALLTTFLSYLLGPKTNMVLFVVSVLIYFYSIGRFKIKRKTFLMVLIGFPLFIMVYFPISQSFRLVKQMTVKSNSSHSFTDVVDNYIKMSDVDINDIKDYTDDYVKRRSLNVFFCLDWSNVKSFQGNGLLTYYVAKSLLPLNKEELGINDNILGDEYLSKGADVGESIFAWFNADFRYLGVILALFFYIAIYASFFYFYTFWGRIFKNSTIILLAVINSLRYSFSIECNPCSFFHPFYAEFLIGVITFGLLCKVFKVILINKSFKICV